MAWRKAAAGPAGGPVAVLLAAEREAAAAGDGERLAQVRSWLDMLAAAGNDPDLADLFATFAREGW